MNMNDMLMIGALIEMQANAHKPKTKDALEETYAQGVLLVWIFGILGLVLMVAGMATEQLVPAVAGVVTLFVALVLPMIGRSVREREFAELRQKEAEEYAKAQRSYAWLREDFKNALREVRDEDRCKLTEDWLQRNETMLTPETLANIRRIAKGRN